MSVNFLDITLDLSGGSYRPYREPNNDPIYINSHSNHPPSIIRQLPESINKRISQLSSDELSFNFLLRYMIMKPLCNEAITTLR